MWCFISLQPVNHLHYHCYPGKYEHMDWLFHFYCTVHITSNQSLWVKVKFVSLSLCCIPSEEDEERWGYKRVCQHPTQRCQETLQSLTTACANYKDKSVIKAMDGFVRALRCANHKPAVYVWSLLKYKTACKRSNRFLQQIATWCTKQRSFSRGTKHAKNMTSEYVGKINKNTRISFFNCVAVITVKIK